MADLELPKTTRQPTESEIQDYDFRGRDPRGLLIEKEIRIEMIESKLQNVMHRVYDVSRKNLELEQEISVGNRRFRDLLQAKSKSAIPAYLFDYFMQSHPLIAEEERAKLMADA